MALEDFLEIPEGTQVTAENGQLTVSKGGKSITKNLKNAMVEIATEGNKIIFKAPKNTKRERKILGTFKAHIKTMFKGADEGHTYKMKICSGHFPMNVAVSGSKFEVKNFLGEAVPRILELKKGVDVKVNGEEIVLQGPDKNQVGQVAADIETLTKVKGRDLRIFQDGIYIVEKDGKVL